MDFKSIERRWMGGAKEDLITPNAFLYIVGSQDDLVSFPTLKCQDPPVTNAVSF